MSRAARIGVLAAACGALAVTLPVSGAPAQFLVGIGDPAVGNQLANGSEDRAEPPRRRGRPESSAPPAPPTARDLTDPRAPSAALARTGADGTVPAFVGGTALVLGGAALFRRIRSGAGG
ncbi:LPXTG cell wall anchor domain-containing protein [Streptomyces sp. JW3]|uniref:LPXTG cell wall anchor domain-containing protein n=1 Tax=Streptomyces sp. JW3 TaxID=3456955 RepID=UPI003FA40541